MFNLEVADLIPGALPEPMRWVIEDGWIVECTGGEAAEHATWLFKKVPGGRRDLVRASSRTILPMRSSLRGGRVGRGSPASI